MNQNHKGTRKYNRAQAAAEMAIFGAILIFVIGLVLRTGLGSSQNTNAQLRAFRMALTESYKTAQGTYRSPRRPSSQRNSASVLLIEDRLSVDASSPTGTRNRFPVVAQASATMSNHLMLTITHPNNEAHLIPVMDVIINGQRFPFTLTGFRPMYLEETIYPLCGDPTRSCPDSSTFPMCSVRPPIGACWEPECKIRYTQNPGCPPLSQNCVLPPIRDIATGCVLFHEKIPRFADSTKWCDDVTVPCVDNLPADWRFNLDLDQNINEPYPADPLAEIENAPWDVWDPDPDIRDSMRANFSWQWWQVAAVQPSIESSLEIPDPTNRAGPPLTGIQGTHPPNNKNTFLDVDGDYVEEVILQAFYDGRGRVTSMIVMDNDFGDVDPSLTPEKSGRWTIVRPEGDPAQCAGRAPPNGFCRLEDEVYALDGARQCSLWRCLEVTYGLLNDLRMFTFTNDGTAYRVEQGQLFSVDTGNLIRNTTRQDHVDLIQRAFRLRNNTHRFCSADDPPVPQDWSGPVGVTWGLVGLKNPIEACGNCFSRDNIQLTCLEDVVNQANGEHDYIIFIRSRLEDLRGHRWITRMDL